MRLTYSPLTPPNLLCGFLITVLTLSTTFQTTKADVCEKDVENVTVCTRTLKEVIENPCQDKNEHCSFWADLGECKVNPNYMLTHCAVSCKECPDYLNGGRSEKDDTIDYGVSQRSYGDTSAEKQTMQEHKKTMEEYGLKYVTNPDTSKKAKTLCRNELDTCSYYATKGLCESKIIFMMENCPLACRMCDRKEKFDECVGMRDPQSWPVFVSHDEYQLFLEHDSEEGDNEDAEEGKEPKGDFLQTVDSFFHSFTKEEAKRELVNKYDFEYLVKDSKSWVAKFDSFLSIEESNAIIDLGKKIGWKDVSDSTTSSKQKSTKSFQSAKCSNSKKGKCAKNKNLRSIIERISEITNIPMNHFEPAEVKLYSEKKGYQSFQAQQFDIHDTWKMAGQKVLSIYIPLTNEDVQGGYLGFPELDWLMIPPSPGQMILMSNVMSKDPELMNPKMHHEILPVQKGDLYVLQIHVRNYDYKMALSRKCA